MDGAVVTFFDITRVVEGELLGTLVDELHHRVRNMLQVVLAVATHTLRRAGSLEEFGTSFSGRLRALGRAHELVSVGGWSDVPLEDLILKELQPYAESRERLVVRGSPLRLRPKAALALGMVLHELATNAAKHGALATEHGRVTVTWTTGSAVPEASFVVVWTEEGGPEIRQPPERRGFGSELIERQLRYDLGGSMEMEFATTGLRVTLTLSPKAIASSIRRPLDGT